MVLVNILEMIALMLCKRVNGTNYADGDNEYFVYTATVNGGLIISSVNETNR